MVDDAEDDTRAIVAVATTACSACEMVKPITAFSKDKRDKKYGVRHACKQCCSQSAREMRLAKKKQVDAGV